MAGKKAHHGRRVRLGMLLLIGMIGAPGSASAQWTRYPFGYADAPDAGVQRSWRRPESPVPRVRLEPLTPRARLEPTERETRERTAQLPARSSGRVVIVVSTDLQKLTVYDDGISVATSSVSTGVADHPTPHGVFSVIGKERYHESNLYSAAPMPWMQRITWSGVALHEGRVTGRPASHGCIRLPGAFAVALFRYTREGARVIISRDDVVPTPWGGIQLFAKPAMPAFALRPSGESIIADESSKPYDIEIEARPRMRPIETAPSAARDFGAGAPLSLLVSRKAGKLYVRRAQKPLFTVPITIDDPARPLGTHFFMAGADQAKTWSSLTLDEPVREASLIDEGRRSTRSRAMSPIAQPPSTAHDALSRLHLAPGIAAYIGSLLTPGATLILSDDGARNRETWDGTNFIALTD